MSRSERVARRTVGPGLPGSRLLGAGEVEPAQALADAATVGLPHARVYRARLRSRVAGPWPLLSLVGRPGR